MAPRLSREALKASAEKREGAKVPARAVPMKRPSSEEEPLSKKRREAGSGSGPSTAAVPPPARRAEGSPGARRGEGTSATPASSSRAPVAAAGRAAESSAARGPVAPARGRAESSPRGPTAASARGPATGDKDPLSAPDCRGVLDRTEVDRVSKLSWEDQLAMAAHTSAMAVGLIQLSLRNSPRGGPSEVDGLRKQLEDARAEAARAKAAAQAAEAETARVKEGQAALKAELGEAAKKGHDAAALVRARTQEANIAKAKVIEVEAATEKKVAEVEAAAKAKVVELVSVVHAKEAELVAKGKELETAKTAAVEEFRNSEAYKEALSMEALEYYEGGFKDAVRGAKRLEPSLDVHQLTVAKGLDGAFDGPNPWTGEAEEE